MNRIMLLDLFLQKEIKRYDYDYRSLRSPFTNGGRNLFPWSNDNASGVAMLLALGETIKSKPLKKYNTLLVHLREKRQGLWGRSI